MKRPLRTLAIIFSVALNIAFLASYAYRAAAPRQEFAYEELSLDADQLARMISSRDRFLADIDRIGNKIVTLHAGLIDAVAVDPLDRAAIDTRRVEIHAQQQLMQKAVVEHLLEDKNILRPDQRQQFFSILKRRMGSQGLPGPPWLPRDRKARQSGSGVAAQ
jgi:hypothetical protein